MALDAMAEDDGSAAARVPFGAARDEDGGRDAANRRERAEQLKREVEALPQTYREILMLYYYQDCTYRDLAEALGVSPATINARLTKARAMLRSRMMAEQE